jgi:hypothetical protein
MESGYTQCQQWYFLFIFLVEEAYTQQGRAHIRRPSTPRAWEDPRWQFQGICIAYLSFSLLRRRKSDSKKGNDLS